MGTTYTALANGDNPNLCFVMAIEGYQYLLTTHDDTSAVATAWAATDWSDVIRGMDYPGSLGGSITPWENGFDSQIASFRVCPTDASDQFGIDLFKTLPTAGKKTDLTTTLTADGSTVWVSSSTGFSGGTDIYIGNERITIGSVSGNSFINCTRGKYAVGTRENGSNLSKAHALDSYTYGATQNPEVTNYRSGFNGARVELYAHRIVAGVLDTRAQAQLIWSGQIKEITEDDTGSAILTCESTLGMLNDVVLLKRQFTAKMKEGIYLNSAGYPAGAGNPISTASVFSIKITETEQATITPFATTTYNPTIFRAVNGGATQTWEINEGYQSILTLVGFINGWLTAEKDAGRMLGAIKLERNNETQCLQWRIQHDPAGVFNYSVRIQIDNYQFAKLLGNPASETRAFDRTSSATGGSFDFVIGFAELPFRSAPRIDTSNPGHHVIELESAEGSWCITPSAFLPQPWLSDYIGVPSIRTTSSLLVRDAIDAFDMTDLESGGVLANDETAVGGNLFGFFSIDDESIYFGRFQGDRIDQIQIDNAERRAALINLGVMDDEATLTNFRLPGRREGEEGDLVVKQVIIIQGSLKDILARMTLSTGASTHNHSVYDSFPATLSAAQPWSLYGQEFINSLTRLGHACDYDGMTLIIPSPTLFGDVFGTELALRDAHLVFKNGKHVIVSATMPPEDETQALQGAAWVMATSNKAAPIVDSGGLDRSKPRMSSEFCRNIVKVEYGRTLKDGYRFDKEFTNQASVNALGQEKAIKIKARNLLGATESQHEIAEALLGTLATKALTQYAYPLLTVSRSINYTLAFAAPGDYVRVSDSHIRDPNTGLRGISNRLAWIQEIAFDWTNGLGQVALVFPPSKGSGRKTPNFSPAAKINYTDTVLSIGGGGGSSQRAFPDSASSWDTNFPDIANPDNIWGFQEAASPIVDLVGAIDLTANSTILYQQSGESEPTDAPQYSVEFDTTGGADWAGPASTSLGDIVEGTPWSLYFRFSIPDNGTTQRSLVNKAAVAPRWVVNVQSGGAVRFQIVDGTTTFTINNPSGWDDDAFHDCLIVYDPVNSLFRNIVDGNEVTGTSTNFLGISNATVMHFGAGGGTNVLAGTNISYAAFWPGTALTAANLETIRTEIASGGTTYTFDKGYDIPNKALRINPNAFSAPDGPTDSSRFKVGDKVRLLEQAPSIKGGAHTHTDTIAAVDLDNNFFTLTDGFATYSGTVAGYYLLAADYASANADQIAISAYLAASGTELVGAADGWSYGLHPVTTSGVATVSGSIKYERHSTRLTTSGTPLSPVQHHLLASNVNNFLNYRFAPQCPIIHKNNTGFNSDMSEDNWEVFSTEQIYIGDNHCPPGYQRRLFLGPTFHAGNGATSVTVRVTVTDKLPRTDPTVSGAGYTNVVFSKPYKQVIFPEVTGGAYQNLAASGIVIPSTGPTVYVFAEAHANVLTTSVTWLGYHECRVGALEPIE